MIYGLGQKFLDGWGQTSLKTVKYIRKVAKEVRPQLNYPKP